MRAWSSPPPAGRGRMADNDTSSCSFRIFVMSALPVDLGIVEGYYGRPWSRPDREREKKD
jgi:hypothetical protein